MVVESVCDLRAHMSEVGASRREEREEHTLGIRNSEYKGL